MKELGGEDADQRHVVGIGELARARPALAFVPQAPDERAVEDAGIGERLVGEGFFHP